MAGPPGVQKQGRMTSFFAGTPYLAMSAFLLAAFSAGYLLVPAQRKPMLVSGLLCAPFCLFELAFVPEYWSPHRMPGSPLAAGDLIFSFATGGLAWLLAAGVRDRPLRPSFTPGRFVIRYLVPSLVGAGFVVGLWRLGVPIMPAALIGIGVGALVLAGVYRHRVSRMIRGAAGFGLFYSLVLKLALALWPSFLVCWRREGPLDSLVWGLPLGEILWAAGFGAIWPAFISHVFGRYPVLGRNLAAAGREAAP